LALSNLRLFHDSDTRDDATLACVPAPAPACPVTNVLLPSRSRILRVMGAAAVITAVYGEPHIMNAMAIVRHTLTAGAQWRLEVFSDAAMTRTVYDSGLTPVLQVKDLGDLELGVDALGENIYEDWAFRHGTFWFESVQAWAWRLTISDVGAEFIDISRIIAGAAFSPEFNANFGLKHQWVDPSKQQRTAGNSLFTDRLESYRRVDFDLSYMTASDKRTLFDLQRRIGLGGDLFISIYPESASDVDARDGEFHCKAVETNPFTHASPTYFSKSFSFEEV
jgi:hypothetical protein